jgi:diguanylate cyclase (GGDEF)-like protein/PAS domain S-box-containing protein
MTRTGIVTTPRSTAMTVDNSTVRPLVSPVQVRSSPPKYGDFKFSDDDDAVSREARKLQVKHEIERRREKLASLTDLTADINTLLKSTDIGVVFLDSELNVRRFTPAAAHLFNLRPTDTGRPLTELTHFLDIADLVSKLQQVVTTGASLEQEVADVNDQCTYLMRLLPYRREDGSQDGVVLTLVNVNDLKQVQNSLAEQRAFVQKIAESTPDIVSIFELPLGRVTYINHALQRVLGYVPELIYRQGDEGLMSLIHPDDLPAVQEHFENLSQAKDDDILQFEVRFRHQNGEWRWFNQRNTVFQRTADGIPDQILGISTDVTEAHQMQQALEHSETLFRKTLEGSQVIVFTHDLDLRYTWIYNPAATFTPEQVLGRTDADLLPDPDGAAQLMAIKRRAIETEQVQQGEISLLLMDNAPPHCYDGTYSPLYDAEGNLSGVMAVVVDITERKQIELDLQQARQQLEEAQRVARVGSWRHDLPTDQVEWSDELFRIFGLDPTTDDLTFNTWLTLIHPDDRELFLEAYETVRASGSNLNVDVRLFPDQANRQVHINVIGKVKRDGDGTALEMMGTMLDITDRKRTEAALHHQAFYDQLTQLPNRNLFLEQLKLFLRRAQRDHADPFAVLYLDIDEFKEINDTLGHLTGDVFLVEVAQRLQSCLRPGDVVARLGGDEFAMLLEAADRDTALAVAERIQTAFAAPFTPRGQHFDAAASIGIAFYTPDIAQAEDTTLLENADIAMYRAKGQGAGRVEVFEPQMRSQDVARIELKANLKAALSQQQFMLYYQPIVELHSQHLQGFEALLRWQHPNGDLLSPGAFMDVLHSAHFMFDVETWVMEQACQQLQHWIQQFPDLGPGLRLSINLSPESLAKPDLVHRCRQVLRQYTAICPQQLSVEITEDFLIDTSGLILPNLNHLRDLGMGIALDDFGTGYSSLACLHQLPITTVKIDRAFVNALDTDENLMRITTGISALAQVLNLELIAEGIESEQQLAFLLNSGYSLGQGFWFSRPLSAEAALQVLEHPGSLSQR